MLTVLKHLPRTELIAQLSVTERGERGSSEILPLFLFSQVLNKHTFVWSVTPGLVGEYIKGVETCVLPETVIILTYV